MVAKLDEKNLRLSACDPRLEGKVFDEPESFERVQRPVTLHCWKRNSCIGMLTFFLPTAPKTIFQVTRLQKSQRRSTHEVN